MCVTSKITRVLWKPEIFHAVENLQKYSHVIAMGNELVVNNFLFFKKRKELRTQIGLYNTDLLHPNAKQFC